MFHHTSSLSVPSHVLKREKLNSCFLQSTARKALLHPVSVSLVCGVFFNSKWTALSYSVILKMTASFFSKLVNANEDLSSVFSQQ